MITFKRVDHFHICVPPDLLQEARAFYGGILGLNEIYRPDHLFSSPGYWFDIGDGQLHVGVEASLPQSIRHTALEVTDIAAAQLHLESNGLEILTEPIITGRIRFSFLDPFGNRMELIQITA